MKRYLISRPMYDADTGGSAGGGGGAAGTDEAGASAAGGQSGGTKTESLADSSGGTKTDPPAAIPSADEIISKMQSQIQAAADEAVKKAGMSPEEKAAHEQAQRIAEIDKREQVITLRELRAETAQTLVAKNLPAEALDVVLGADKAATEKNIAAFTAMFDAAVQKQVETRLAGKTPPAGQEQKPGDAVRDQFRNALSGF